MVASLNNSDDYEWEISKTSGKMPINYLIGYKKDDNESDRKNG